VKHMIYLYIHDADADLVGSTVPQIEETKKSPTFVCAKLSFQRHWDKILDCSVTHIQKFLHSRC